MDKIVIIVIFLIAAKLVAQDQGSISGTILDLEMNEEPMLMANVQLKGQAQKAETNFHGNFELKDVPVGEHTLVVSYAGYDNLEIPVFIEKDKTSKIQCGLSQKTILLNDYAVNTADRTDFHLPPTSSLK
ncbi:MAG: carboxypeptidase-like regulatory domain-containing protein [Maribacter sp.]|uniref:carboxypeptidase-like regulatory domain-containing protein n=1 Tax=Maribacter sp. TaxID=1897614 RepID=UPI003C7064A0